MGMTRYRQRTHNPSTGDPYRGIETLIKYKGLVLNDRRYQDTYEISEVTGMDDADVRDSREDNPEFDGESAYNSFYSGRTVTIKGEIQAGNISMVREMQNNLKYAYNYLQESPLDFIFNDVDEDFNDTNAPLDFYTATSVATGVPASYANPTGLTIANGKLYATSFGSLPTMHVNGAKFSDFEAVIAFRTGASIPSGSSVGCGGRWTGTATSQFLEYQFGNPSGTHLLRVRYSGSSLVTSNATIAPNTDYWCRMGASGDYYYAQVYTEDPDLNESASVFNSVSGVLTGANATSIGSAVKGWLAINLTGTGTAGSVWECNSVSARNGDFPDGRIYARKIGKVDMPDSQTSRVPRRQFMVTMRASDPRIVSRTYPGASGDVSVTGITFPGGGGGITLPTTFGSLILTINNRGNYYSYPVVRFYGGLVNPQLYNANTGEKISIETTINDGKYIEVDVKARTIIDSNGNNVYGYLADDHDWMKLSPGISNLYLGNDSFSGADPRVEVYWRHSWL